MNTSIVVKSIVSEKDNVLTLLCTDLRGVDWTFDFTYPNAYYPTAMAGNLAGDLRDGKQPMLFLRYNEARDKYLVVDEYNNEVVLSRFSNWQEVTD